MKKTPEQDPPLAVPAQRPATREGEVRGRWPHAEAVVWTERMLVTLERGPKNGVWHSLIDKVYALPTLSRAWEQVQAKGGAGGVDRVSVGMFAQTAEQELEVLSRQLREGTYRPLSARRVYIPKPGSKEKRPLGIPAVRDRVVQAALRMVLEPIFERDFAPESHGFRPGRGCADALRRVEGLLEEGYVHVVDADLKSFFDTIPHEPLLARVRAKVVDGKVLALLRAFLEQGVMEEMGQWSPTLRGTPQGGVISPLLANIYLDALDWKLRFAGWELVRYADDFVVLCRCREHAQEVLCMVQSWCEQAGLQLHPEKTRLVDMNQPGGFDFLGYHFDSDGRRWARQKSVQKMRAALRALTPRTCGQHLPLLIQRDLNPRLRGWYAYFRRCNKWTMRGIDGYVRARLRGILRKRRGGRGRGRGRDNNRWPNTFFDQLGLLCLEQLWQANPPVP